MDLEDDGIPASSLREISVLRTVNHPNILSLKDVFSESSNLCLVLEFMDMDLKRWLSSGSRHCPPDLLRSYVFQMLCGCQALHLRGIVHRNIDPSHCLINRNGMLKLCDFSTVFWTEYPRAVPRPRLEMTWYRAPETLVDEGAVDFAVDIWSCGCVVAELVRGSPLFCGDCAIDQLMNICQGIGTPTHAEWPELYELADPEMRFPDIPPPPFTTLVPTDDPELIDLLALLLQANPARRIAAEDALRHSYFHGLPSTIVDFFMTGLGDEVCV
jgi:serine/threonine protein kinase